MGAVKSRSSLQKTFILSDLCYLVRIFDMDIFLSRTLQTGVIRNNFCKLRTIPYVLSTYISGIISRHKNVDDPMGRG